jgi:hypothetical protein
MPGRFIVSITQFALLVKIAIFGVALGTTIGQRTELSRSRSMVIAHVI